MPQPLPGLGLEPCKRRPHSSLSSTLLSPGLRMNPGLVLHLSSSPEQRLQLSPPDGVLLLCFFQSCYRPPPGCEGHRCPSLGPASGRAESHLSILPYLSAVAGGVGGVSLPLARCPPTTQVPSASLIEHSKCPPTSLPLACSLCMECSVLPNPWGLLPCSYRTLLKDCLVREAFPITLPSLNPA